MTRSAAIQIGPALLALLGPRAAKAAELSAADWEQLDALASDHRLQPHLHARTTRGEIGTEVPAVIAARWRDAHRSNAIAMLAQRRDLLLAGQVLGAAGIGAVALKGSALAWRGYPAPAERMMRDIDILVPQAQAPAGYHALRSAGWDAPEMTAGQLETLAQEAKHLPPLRSPSGETLELHAHAWEPLPAPGRFMPPTDDDGLLARAAECKQLGIATLAGEDLLAHLIVHAVYSHRFNNGPLLLADVDYAVAADLPDWPRLRERAIRDGWQRGAQLVLALVDHWRRPGVYAHSGFGDLPDAAILAEAGALLVQDVGARKDITALAALQSGGSGSVRSGAAGQGRSTAGQLGRRAVSLARSMTRAPIRASAAQTARLDRWLAG
ncbi:nucleotidyltransferase domain-containing protein [Qipengyuania marisflavi]|uniref:Nucleotidyltransferase family protein n=1 Tax=Qipengyuania marisflavi TaxID=2486356 RepID=A0A5S3P5M1_9SPHN|nr:nucleotidyltransferase family protein [Qipengyuania marisflavi]TMM48340.1 nucleotidyltransferase family protein [Qipengyuania marisflavi]